MEEQDKLEFLKKHGWVMASMDAPFHHADSRPSLAIMPPPEIDSDRKVVSISKGYDMQLDFICKHKERWTC